MLLAIDVGNSHTVLGCFWDGALKKTWRVSTHPLCTADEFRSKLYQMFKIDGIELSAFESVIVSSVVPPFSAMLRQAFKNVRLDFVDSHSPFSFTIAANPANQVGADRLINAEAVVKEYGSPAIVVDSGTATTICAISRENQYLGGAIMPGIELSIETLARKTAKLFVVELRPPEKAIGTNTQSALQSGILFGYSSMIDGMIRRFKEELGAPRARVIATGGVSDLLKGLTKEIDVFDSELTLKGLAHLNDTLRSR